MNHPFSEIKKNFAFGMMRLPMIGENVDIPQTTKMVDAFMEAGFNYFDTAHPYIQGKSELAVKECLSSRYPRESYVLTNKLSGFCFEKEEEIRPLFQSQLEACGVEYFDFYLHHAMSAQRHEKHTNTNAYEIVKEFKEQGKIRHIGLTAHSLVTFEKALEMDWVETIMFPYNIVESQGEALIRRCTEKNIGFICMKPLAGGALEDATLALRYIVNNDDVTVVIPGMAEEKEIAQNIAAVCDRAPLSAGELAAIENIRNTLGTQFCRRCNYCAPCTAGISISAVFLLEGYLSRYGLADWAQMRYNNMAVKASECVDCGICETRCPYNLPIRDMLKSAAKKFEK